MGASGLVSSRICMGGDKGTIAAGYREGRAGTSTLLS